MLKILILLTSLISLNLFSSPKIICTSNETNNFKILNPKGIGYDNISINGIHYDLINPSADALSFNVGFGVPEITAYINQDSGKVVTIVFLNYDIDSSRRGFEGIVMRVYEERKKDYLVNCELDY